jgi:hypothetical protein
MVTGRIGQRKVGRKGDHMTSTFCNGRKESIMRRVAVIMLMWAVFVLSAPVVLTSDIAMASV